MTKKIISLMIVLSILVSVLNFAIMPVQARFIYFYEEGFTEYLSSIAFGNGKFVAVANNGYVLTSENGADWSIATETIPGRSYSKVVFGNGIFLVTDSQKNFYTSTDAITWTKTSYTWDSDKYVNLKFVNGNFIAFGYKSVYNSSTYTIDYFNKMAYSADGITWTNGNISGMAKGLTDVTYGSSKYVFSTSEATFYTSSSLSSSWTKKEIADMYNWSWTGINNINYIGNAFVAGMPNEDILRSTSPESSWSKLTTGKYILGGFNANGKNHLIGTDKLYHTTGDGSSWSSWSSATIPVDEDYGNYLTGLTFGNGVYVGIDGYNILYSQNLSTWGQIQGLGEESSNKPAVVLTADTTNHDVDHDITITFSPDAEFEAAITEISFNGNKLNSNQYTVSSGTITLRPSVAGNLYLRTPATGEVVITATGYEVSTVSQTITAGAVASLAVSTQPVPGESNGSSFATQPVVTLKDQYGNICSSGPSATSVVTAIENPGTGSWILGGTPTLAASEGVVRFTDLSSVLLTSGTGTITFRAWPVEVTSDSFTIPTTQPVFTGSATTFTVEQYSGATDIRNLLVVFDPDVGKTLAWSASVAPSHGTLTFSGATAPSGPASYPGGTVTYQPVAGYFGSDSFTVQVSDGVKSSTRTFTVTVTEAPKKTLTVKGVTVVSKTYDGTTTAQLDFSGTTFEGVETGHIVEIDFSNANGVFDNANVGTEKSVSITGMTIGGADANRYELAPVVAKGEIKPKAITVTADGKSKIYGDADPALTYQVNQGGLVGADALTGSLTRVPGENVGNYAIGKGTLSNSNYSITFAPANLTISPRPITITADAKSKIYGGADPALTWKITSGSLVGTDAVTGSLARDAGEEKGVYDIKQNTLSINNNYTITYVPANLTISEKAITVTAQAKTKVYGDADPALTYQATGLLGEDKLTGSLSRAPGENVGDYAITKGTLANNNYSINFVPANLTISRRPVTITADAKSKVYGDADPALTWKLTSGSLVGTDSVTGTLGRDAGEAKGTYAIKQNTLAINHNYTLTFVPANLTIAEKAVTVTVQAKSKVYGNADPELTYQATGLLGEDKLTGSLTRAPGETVGDYAITKGTLANGNYSITFVPANLTISRRPVTITADAKSKVYGDADPALTWKLTSGSLVGTDAVTGSLEREAGEAKDSYAIRINTLAINNNYSITYVPANLTIAAKPITVTAQAKTKVYGDADPALTYQATGLVGTDTLTGALARDAGSDVGEYNITKGTLNNPNYTINYQPAKLTITKKTLTVTADNKSKTYGDNNPALTVRYSGFAQGDTETVLETNPEASTQVTAASGIGEYPIAVSGGSAKNYALSYVNGKLTVQKRPITVKADDKQKSNGDSDPALTYTITNGNLIGSDTFTGSLSRDAGENITSSPQNYDIKQNTLALSENYALTFAKGTFTILPSKESALLSVVEPENTEMDGLQLQSTVRYEVEAVTLDITTSPFSTWKLYSDQECTQEIKGAMPLSVGDNTAYIKVTAQDATTNTVYTLTIHRKSNNADLKLLSLSSGELNPVFQKNQTEYTVILKGSDTSIQVLPTADDSEYASIQVNGAVVESTKPSEAIEVALGKNEPIHIEVTAEDGNTKTYTITPTRLSGNHKLTSLSTSEGSLNPAFDAETLAYTVNVKNAVSTVTLTPVVQETGKATVKINGIGLSNVKASLPVSVSEGTNVVNVAVRAEDGTERIYKITIVRELKPNAKNANNNLISLLPSKGMLYPDFDKNKTDYTVWVDHSVSNIQFTPQSEETKTSVVKVNGAVVQSGTASGDIALIEGNNNISVAVQAENGSIKTYQVAVKRASAQASNNADLSGLSISTGTLSTTFDSNITVYTAAVGMNVINLTVTGVTSDKNAVLTINGEKAISGEGSVVPLKVGANTITVKAIAEDGTVKEYTLLVTRYSNRLIDLKLSAGVLSPVFHRDELFYSTSVEHSVQSLSLTPFLESAGASVEINGVAATNGQPGQSISLNEGVNEISAVITSENGEKKTYSVIVYRKGADTRASDIVISLIKTITDRFGDLPTDEELVAAKGGIEEAFIGYHSLTDDKKKEITSEQKKELVGLYQQLIHLSSYENKQVGGNYSVEVAEGFINHLATKLSADDGQKLTIKLNVNKIDPPVTTALGKQVADTFALSVTETVTRNSDQTVLAVNNHVQPISGKTLTIKIKVPEALKNYSGLDIVKFDSVGQVASQNALIVPEGDATYLVFKASQLSQFAIVYTKPVVPSRNTGGGSSTIVVLPAMHEAYIKGYPDNTFKPENGITRAETASVLARLSSGYKQGLFYAADFSDLEPQGWYLNEVGYGSLNGLISGYGDGSFRPNERITRAEFVSIVARFLSLDVQTKETSFIDVSGHWAEGYIVALFEKGLISGYEDSSFRPETAITRAEAVTIINAALNRKPSKAIVDKNIGSYDVPFHDVDKSHWAYYEILEAAIKHEVSDFN